MDGHKSSTLFTTSSELAVSNLVPALMGKERAKKFQIFASDIMVTKKKPALGYDEAETSQCVIF